MNIRQVAKVADLCNCVCVLEHITEKGPCKICNISAYIRGFYKKKFINQKKTYLTLVLRKIKKVKFYLFS